MRKTTQMIRMTIPAGETKGVKFPRADKDAADKGSTLDFAHLECQYEKQ
jgi:hypothetical protein